MAKILIALIVLIVILVLFYYPTKQILSYDGIRYAVIGSYANKQAAADLIAALNVDIMKLMRHLKRKYKIDEPGRRVGQDDVVKIVSTALDGYNYEVISENNPVNLTGDTAYTVNKGDKILLCVRDKNDPNKLIDKNTLMFVTLHEISHIANYNGWGHKTRFWTIFKFILQEAIDIGVYTPVDYGQYPINYCGLDVKYSPLYDDGLENIGR